METLLPNVDYVALRDVNYRTFVRAVLEANSPRQITLQEMQLIWDALVYKVFRFECACAKECKANEVSLYRRLNRLPSLTDTYQSMGIDGFNQAQYLQLALDIRCGNPPPRLSLIIRLPLPPHGPIRKRASTSSDSETDDDETGADEVHESHPHQGSRDSDRTLLKEANRMTHRLHADEGEGQKDDIAQVQEKTTAFQASNTFPRYSVNVDLQIQLLIIS